MPFTTNSATSYCTIPYPHNRYGHFTQGRHILISFSVFLYTQLCIHNMLMAAINVCYGCNASLTPSPPSLLPPTPHPLPHGCNAPLTPHPLPPSYPQPPIPSLMDAINAPLTPHPLPPSYPHPLPHGCNAPLTPHPLPQLEGLKSSASGKREGGNGGHCIHGVIRGREGLGVIASME